MIYEVGKSGESREIVWRSVEDKRESWMYVMVTWDMSISSDRVFKFISFAVDIAPMAEQTKENMNVKIRNLEGSIRSLRTFLIEASFTVLNIVQHI